MQENFKIEIDRQAIAQRINEAIDNHVISVIKNQGDSIKNSLEKYFQKQIFSTNRNEFESSLEWIFEAALRKSLERALEETKFNDLLQKEYERILLDKDFINEIAIKRVKATLGIKD